MAANTTFRLKRSSVAGKTPTTVTLSTGELALNLTDKKLYSSDGSNIFEPAGNVSSLYIGNSVSYIAANSTNIVANNGLTINQTDATEYLILKVNGHETKFNPSGGFEASGSMYGGTYGSNLLDVSQAASLKIQGGLYGVDIKSSPDRVNYKTWNFGTDGLLTLPGGINANGSNGSAGQVLTSNGTSTYWSTVTGGSGSVDVNARYTWTNTQTFSNTITFSSVINGTANVANYIGSLPAANVVSNAQLQSNLANYTNTASLSAYIGNHTANDVYYVNGVTAVNVVSNAQLTANLANYTNTASFYLDTLQDVSAGGPTSGQILTWNSTTNQWTPQAPPTVVTGVTPGYYGSFYDANANQTISTTTDAYLVRIANTFEQNGITVVNNTDITFAYTGTYEIIYSIQFFNNDNAQQDINVWYYKNGNNNIADSDSKFTINGKSGSNKGKLIATTPFLSTFNAGDYVRLAWAATATGVSITTDAVGTTPTTPVVPGVIVTVKQISNIISAPPGTNSQLIFNDSGVSNATAGFTFNKTTNNVTIGNSLFVTSTVNAAALDVDGYFVANTTAIYANNALHLTPKSGTTTISTEGTVFYDSLNHAFNVYADTATPHELGQQTFVRVYNATGSTITKGTAVYINGASSNRPTIGKAIADGSINLSQSIGVVFDDIPGTTEGFVLTGGLLQTFDTRNFTAGQQIYISATSAGALSNTQPTYPNYSVPIGYALNSALVGQIYITAQISTLTLPNTNIYISNGTSAFVSNNFTFDYANSVLHVGNSTVNATIGYVDTAGTTTFLTLSGNNNSSLDAVIVNQNTGTNSSSDFAAYDSNGPSSSNFVDMGINGVNWNETFWTINGPSDGYLYTGNSNLSIGTAGAFALNFFTGNTLAANERMRITPTGNVGIGNTTPVNKLSVSGTSYLGGDVTITGNLIVSGTTVTVNTATLDVKDKNITIAKGAVSGIAADGAGLTVDTVNVGWYYNNASNTWQSNVGITPSANLTFDLGTTGLTWSNVYANNIVAANLYGTLLTGSQPYITANNATNLNGQPASFYITTSSISGNVAVLTANAATYLNGKTEGNLNVNNALTANNASYLGTVAASGYQTTAGLAANVNTLTANNSNYLNTKTEANLNVNTALTSNSTTYINGNTAADLNTYANNKAANAYSNAISYADTKAATAYTNATSYADTKAATAYTNAVSYTDSKIATANSAITGNAATSYSNAMSDTLSRNGNYTGNNTLAGTNTIISSNLTVSGTFTNYVSNSVTIGTAAYHVANGNFGISNSTPADKLSINGTTYHGGNVILGSSSLTVGLQANGSYGSAGQVLTSNGSAVYWGAQSSSFVRQQFTGDGLTTSYSISGGYTPSQIDVYINGVKQRNGSDVTVTSGTNVVFAVAPYFGFLIDIVGVTASAVITSTATSTASIAVNNVNFTATTNGISYTVGYFSSTGDASAKTYLLLGTSTSATEIELFSDSTNRIPIRANTTVYYTADIVARGIDVGSGEYAAFNIRGIASANTSNNGFDQGTLMETIVGRSNTSYLVDARANTTTGTINIYATGKASTNIRWVAEVKTVEVSR